MSVTFTQTKALLQTMATTLSAEANSIGLIALSDDLDGLATEIGQSVTEYEFFGGDVPLSSEVKGGAGKVWATVLNSAASIITSANSTLIKNLIQQVENDIQTISTNSTTIANSIDDLAPTVASFTGTISDGYGNPGTILTVSNVTGIISIGMRVIGGNVLSNTFIISGSGSTWQVSQAQDVTSSSLAGYKLNGYLTSLISNISSKQTTIADKQTTIADKQTAMETYQKRVKELGEGNGFRVKSPYEIFSMVSLYKLLIEEAKIFEIEDIDENKKREALERVIEYMREISRNVPKEF